MIRLRQSERTELSDKRMLDAAIKIMIRRGISGLQLSDVGLHAGYSRGLAAMRFGTVHGLLKRVAEHLGQGWLETLNEALRDKRGLAAVYAAIDTQEHWLTKSPKHILGQYLLFFHSMDPGATDRLHSVRVIIAQRRDLSRWIRDAAAAGEVHVGVDPEREAESILSSMIGIIFQALMDPDVSASTLCSKLKADIAGRLAIAPARRVKRASAVAATTARRPSRS